MPPEPAPLPDSVKAEVHASGAPAQLAAAQTPPKPPGLKDYMREDVANAVATITGPKGKPVLLEHLNSRNRNDPVPARTIKDVHDYIWAHLNNPKASRADILKAAEILDNPAVTSSSASEGTAKQAVDAFYQQIDIYRGAKARTPDEGRSDSAKAAAFQQMKHDTWEKANAAFSTLAQRFDAVIQEQYDDRMIHKTLPSPPPPQQPAQLQKPITPALHR